MSACLKSRCILAVSLLGCLTPALGDATNPGEGLNPQGGEYPLTRILPGDQVHPRAALGDDGGYLVWQDNATDEDGTGISAVRIGPGLTPGLDPFRVNADGAGDQEKPAVALLDGGGAIFVWQSGNSIRARVLNADGIFTTADDIIVSTHNSTRKVDPAVAPLNGGGALVLWGSYGQDDADNAEAFGGYRHLQGVFGQALDAQGRKVGSEFQVNQQVLFNQRTPAVARLASGSLAAVWVSEVGQLGIVDGVLTDAVESVDIRARLFSPEGQPVGGEIQVSEPGNIAANPAITASGTGFVVAWCQGDRAVREIGFEIFVRGFNEAGAPTSDPWIVNSHWYGDQFAPRIASASGNELVVWTSLGQDGNREGVFGQFISGTAKLGSEFRVNTTTISQQLHPDVVARGANGFLAVWSSYVGSPGDFELMGQRYAMTMPPAPTPTVSALSANRLSLAWPAVGGYEDVEYLVYVDGSTTPEVTSEIIWNSGPVFQPASVHTFRLAFRLPGGTVSPLSDVATGKTWGPDDNFDGLPDDWQAQYWGSSPAKWPSPNADSDGDGMSNRDEFLAGTDPTDKNQLLRTRVSATPQGAALSWNTTPGLVYQVEESPDLKSWTPLGVPRFARSTEDQVPIGSPGVTRYYRVIRLR